MRFYVTPAGEWFTDKTAAGKSARSMDVPTDKQGLRAFFNVHRCAATRPCDPEPDLLNQDVPEHEIHNTGSSFDTPPADPAREERRAFKLRVGSEADQIAEYILEANGFALSNIIAASIERLQRLNGKASA